MSGQIPIDMIVEKTLDGIVQAQKDYESWTGGEWLWSAPEYMLNTYIAQKIAKLDGAKYLTLENSAKSAIKEAGARGRGKLHLKIRASGRFDVLLWWGSSYSPRAVIEVKNQISRLANIKEDLDRIAQVLKRTTSETSFQFGLVAYYTSCDDNKEFSAKKQIANRIKKIYKDTKALLGNDFKVSSHSKRIKVDGVSAWVAAAILIKYKGT